MSPRSKREYREAVNLRYINATRHEKTAILDEFCATCGCHRKHAIRVFRRFKRLTKPKAKKRGKSSVYQKEEIRKPLKEIWLAANLPCSKRLKVMLPITIHHLKGLNGALINLLPAVNYQSFMSGGADNCWLSFVQINIPLPAVIIMPFAFRLLSTPYTGNFLSPVLLTISSTETHSSFPFLMTSRTVFCIEPLFLSFTTVVGFAFFITFLILDTDSAFVFIAFIFGISFFDFGILSVNF